MTDTHDSNNTKNQIAPIVIPPEIRVYIEDLLNSSGTVSVDSVMREAMIQEIFVRLDKFLTLKMLDYLPTEKLEEFADITEKNPSSEEVQKYIEKNIPNSKDIFTVAFGEFRDLYLNGINSEDTQGIEDKNVSK